MSTAVAHTASTSNVTKAGWICLLIGVVMELIPFPLFWVYGGLFAAAFVLAIVAITRGQTGQGIVLLIASMIIPIIGWFAGLAILGAAMS
jgi:hypothetical protein